MPTRRDFLAGAASTGLLAALPPLPPLSLDRSFIPREGERRAYSTPALDDTDLSWVARLRGRSRAVFDSPQISEGYALWRATLWRRQVNSAFGTPIEDVTPVIVFRHDGIALVMNDEFWRHMDMGKRAQLRDPNGKKWAKANPLSGSAADPSADTSDMNIPAFIRNGGIVLACGLAFGDVVDMYVKEDRLSPEEATARAKQHLIPGVVMQPSGFFAVLKAQEEGCNYMLGS